MKKKIPLVLVLVLGLAAEIAKADFAFDEPTNLGPAVNSSHGEFDPSVSADGLSLYFSSDSPGGSGNYDLWVTKQQTTRQTTELVWSNPINLGPNINSSGRDIEPSISSDGLSLYFSSDRPGGSGLVDLYVTRRASLSEGWGPPVNLGPTINSSVHDFSPSISADELSLFFADADWIGSSPRPGGYGAADIWITVRPTKDDTWGAPMNLGPIVNSSSIDCAPSISADGLVLFFHRGPFGSSLSDIWVTTRATTEGEWGTPVNLGSKVNSSVWDGNADVSTDGSTLFFASERRPGGLGGGDLWQVKILPVVDLNTDDIVDAADMCIMVDHWGTNEPLCDIGPMPWGDGIVDVQDLIVLAEHLFEEFPPVE
jgi:Tol biopolymer transport system component